MLFTVPTKEQSKKRIANAIPTKRYPPACYDLFDHWVTVGGTKHKTTSNTYHSAMKALRDLLSGTYFQDNSEYLEYSEKKFTRDEIHSALTKFESVLKDPSVAPFNKKYVKCLSLEQWVFNPNATTHNSWFLKLHKEGITAIEGHKPKTQNNVRYADFPHIEYADNFYGYEQARAFDSFEDWRFEVDAGDFPMAESHDACVQNPKETMEKFRESLREIFDDEGKPLTETDFVVFVSCCEDVLDDGNKLDFMSDWQNFMNGLKHSWVTSNGKIQRRTLFSSKVWKNKDVRKALKAQGATI